MVILLHNYMLNKMPTFQLWSGNFPKVEGLVSKVEIASRIEMGSTHREKKVIHVKQMRVLEILQKVVM